MGFEAENEARKKAFADCLQGKTALVTGGSRGLGLQMALALGEQGAKVVLSSRKQADLDEAVAFLARHGVTAYAIAADLGKEAAVGPLVDAAMEKLGGHIDIQEDAADVQ
eukprot:gene35525-40183_t